MASEYHDAVAQAAELIGDRVRRTPILVAEPDFFDTVEPVPVKLELLQHTGSFKPRGAFNKILSSPRNDAGVIAASGGNHGAAVAFVAQTMGLRAEIFVPEVAPAIKIRAMESFGAVVHVIGGIYDNAYAACAERALETGALLVHAFNDPATIAGQGTMAMEIAEQIPDADTVLIATGGGGLAAGAADWFGPDGPTVVVVEPERSNCYAAAKAAGEPVSIAAAGVAVDSLGAGTIGQMAFDRLMAVDAPSVTVSDDAIVMMQRRFWDKMRLIVEPGGATAPAALLSGRYVPAPGERVVAVACGANCSPVSITGVE